MGKLKLTCLSFWQLLRFFLTLQNLGKAIKNAPLSLQKNQCEVLAFLVGGITGKCNNECFSFLYKLAKV